MDTQVHLAEGGNGAARVSTLPAPPPLHRLTPDPVQEKLRPKEE